MKEKRFFVYKGGLIHKASVDAETLPKMFHAAEKDYSYDVQWSIPQMPPAKSCKSDTQKTDRWQTKAAK